MQETEVVLSEIHINSDNVAIPNDQLPPEQRAFGIPRKVVRSRFRFRLPVLKDCRKETAADGVELDEDGDVLVSRQHDTESYITIDHHLATPLKSVGLQVWKGALLLADFLLDSGDSLLRGKGVLELGGGTGLCSIVAAMFADVVYCTDRGNDVLSLCRRNLFQNDHLYDLFHDRPREIHVRELDWRRPNLFQVGDAPWSWMGSDERNRDKIDLFLAADVVYSDELTDSFVAALEHIVRDGQTVYIALEKRINFTIEDLDVASPSHRHFLRHLERLEKNGWTVEELSTDFPQYFNYSRDMYMELWQLTGPTST